MKTIEVNNMPILLDLRFELSLKNLEKYATKKTPKYIIRSVLDDLDLPRIMASQRTKYYDIFEYDNIVLQRVHTEDGILIGYLKYESNNITIYNASSFDKEYMLSQYALVYCLRCEQNAIFMALHLNIKIKELFLQPKVGLVNQPIELCGKDYLI